MRYLISLIGLILLLNSTSGQNSITLPNGMKPCWKNIILADSTEGILIKYFPKRVLCRPDVPSISVALIRLTNGDTIRVRQYCAITTDLLPNDLIIIHPYVHARTEEAILPSDEEALTCRVTMTIDGGILKKWGTVKKPTSK